MKDILIVEDGEFERKRLQELFTSHSYGVVACDSVGAAERALQVDTFRLAILDIGLGDRSGSHFFNSIKRATPSTYIIIFTGNPSLHLKQRFIDEGAVDYIVKGSPQAQNEAFVNRIREIIGESVASKDEGIELDLFLNRYVPSTSRELFLDHENSYPKCKSCAGNSYLVVFSHQAQLPPQINGIVVCANCRRPMDPEVG